MTVFLPRIWNRRGSWLGIDAGFFNSRLLTSETFTVARTFATTGADSLQYRRILQARSQTVTSTTEKLTLYLAPTLRLTNNLYFTVQSEFAQAVERQSAVSKTLSADTALYPYSDSLQLRQFRLTRRDIRDAPAPTADTVTSPRRTYLTAFHGVGAIVSVVRPGSEFRVKPIVGIAPQLGNAGYYAVQFRISDFSSGLKVGGEVRGMISGARTSTMVYLAKDWGLSKLGKFIGGGEK